MTKGRFDLIGKRAPIWVSYVPSHRVLPSPASLPEWGDEAATGLVYGSPMHTFASIAIGLLMFATIAVLFAGMIGMVRGNSGAASNRLMRYRVLLQGATLLLLVIFMSLLRS
jgi:hypothetical protein